MKKERRASDDEQDQSSKPPEIRDPADEIADERCPQHHSNDQRRSRQATTNKGRRFVREVRAFTGDESDIGP